jgi:hypothetical protein
LQRSRYSPARDHRPGPRQMDTARRSVGRSTTSSAISRSRRCSVSLGPGPWWSGEPSWPSRRCWRACKL